MCHMRLLEDLARLSNQLRPMTHKQFMREAWLTVGLAILMVVVAVAVALYIDGTLGQWFGGNTS